MEERERIERVEAIEIDFLSFLKGRAMAVAPFCMFRLKDAALLEVVDDLVEDVSVDFAMMEKGYRMAYRWGQSPIYSSPEPIFDMQTIFIVIDLEVPSHGRRKREKLTCEFHQAKLTG